MEPYITSSEYYTLQKSIRQNFSRSEFVKRFRFSKRSKKVGTRGGVREICDICGESFPPTKLEVHHISPCIEIGKSYLDYTIDEFVHRVWVSTDELQLLCIECHDSCTSDQQEERKKYDK